MLNLFPKQCIQYPSTMTMTKQEKDTNLFGFESLFSLPALPECVPQVHQQGLVLCAEGRFL